MDKEKEILLLKEEIEYLNIMNKSLMTMLKRQTQNSLDMIENFDKEIDNYSNIFRECNQEFKKNKLYNKNTSSNSGLRNDDIEL